MTSLAFTLASTFWVLSPAIFLAGRLLGVWNFQKDCLIFGILMGICFLTCLVHIAINIINYKREALDEAYLKHLVNKVMDERIRK